MKLSRAHGEFRLANRANGLSPASLTWYKAIINLMIEQLGDHELEDITPAMMRAYVAEMRERTTRYHNAPQKPEQEGAPADATIAAYLRALHRFFAWCADEYDIRNPMKGIKRPKQGKPEPKALEAGAFVKLFNATTDDALGYRDRALLALLADSGARIGGVLGLKVEEIDFAKRTARVTEKGNKTRLVFFTTFTARLLMFWLAHRDNQQSSWLFTNRRGTRLTHSGAYQVIKRLKRQAGVKGRANPHAFRHAFAREYIRHGGDVVTLSRILGHESVEVTAAYYAVFSEDELKEFHAKHTPMARLVDELE